MVFLNWWEVRTRYWRFAHFGFTKLRTFQRSFFGHFVLILFLLISMQSCNYSSNNGIFTNLLQFVYFRYLRKYLSPCRLYQKVLTLHATCYATQKRLLELRFEQELLAVLSDCPCCKALGTRKCMIASQPTCVWILWVFYNTSHIGATPHVRSMFTSIERIIYVLTVNLTGGEAPCSHLLKEYLWFFC